MIGTTCVKLKPESTTRMHSGWGDIGFAKRSPYGIRDAASPEIVARLKIVEEAVDETYARNDNMNQTRIPRKQIDHKLLGYLANWNRALLSKEMLRMCSPILKECQRAWVIFPELYSPTPNTSSEKIPSHTAFCASQSTRYPLCSVRYYSFTRGGKK